MCIGRLLQRPTRDRRPACRSPVVCRAAHKTWGRCQTACKPGSVRRRLAPARDGHSSGTPVARRFEQPTRTAGFGHRSWNAAAACATPGSTPSLFGFAPGGVCRAAGVAVSAVRSCRTVSPLPHPPLRPEGMRGRRGGLFSVALSLGSPPPDVIRHRMSMEPGLSSPATFRSLPERPSGRLTSEQWGQAPATSRPAVAVDRCVSRCRVSRY